MNCLKCNSEYVYEDGPMLVCPECGYEWDPKLIAEDDGEEETIIKDANGTPLKAGDKVTLSKSLKVKGSTLVLKIGTKATIKRLADGDHNIDCKVDGQGDMMLKSEFVKKS